MYGFYHHGPPYPIEYASSVWDPHVQNTIHSIEIIQRQGAQLITSNYNWNSGVTSMLVDLQWPILLHRHMISRPKMFYNDHLALKFLHIIPSPPNLHATNIHFISSLLQ